MCLELHGVGRLKVFVQCVTIRITWTSCPGPVVSIERGIGTICPPACSKVVVIVAGRPIGVMVMHTVVMAFWCVEMDVVP